MGGRDRSGGGFPNADYEPHPSCGDCPLTARSRPKSGQNIPKNRCRTTIAERMVETLAELPFIGDQVVCLSHDQAARSGASCCTSRSARTRLPWLPARADPLAGARQRHRPSPSGSDRGELGEVASGPRMTRLTKVDRQILERIAAGWRPLRVQIAAAASERRGLLRLDWGPENTPDADRMSWHLTERGREALKP